MKTRGVAAVWRELVEFMTEHDEVFLAESRREAQEAGLSERHIGEVMAESLLLQAEVDTLLAEPVPPTVQTVQTEATTVQTEPEPQPQPQPIPVALIARTTMLNIANKFSISLRQTAAWSACVGRSLFGYSIKLSWLDTVSGRTQTKSINFSTKAECEAAIASFHEQLAASTWSRLTPAASSAQN